MPYATPASPAISTRRAPSDDLPTPQPSTALRPRPSILRQCSRSHSRSFSHNSGPSFAELPTGFIFVQPASPLAPPPTSKPPTLPMSPHPDSSVAYLTVRSRRARLPYFTPLEFDPKLKPSNPIHVYDYARPPSQQPPTLLSSNDNSLLSAESASHSSPLDRRPRHQKAQSETGTSAMRIDLKSLGTGSHPPFLRQSHHQQPSENGDDEDLSTPMLRKKSGEVVRSSLKSSTDPSCSLSRQAASRAKSAPATPTGPKYVHFDAHLEHVKHFLAQQRPAAVSRDGSPIDTETEGEEEFPFPSMISTTSGPAITTQAPFSRLSLDLINFPSDPDGAARNKYSQVYLRSLELSPDGKSIRGQIQVKNLAFEKFIAVRFTLDNWQTVSEVTADYIESLGQDNWDRFGFTIRLLDLLARIEERQMEIAIRFTVHGSEIWDNNDGANYVVRFKRLRLPIALKPGQQTKQQLVKSPLPIPIPSSPSPPPPSPPLPSPRPSNKAVPSSSLSTTSNNRGHYQWSVTTDVQAKDRMAELRAELDRFVSDDDGGMSRKILQPVFKTSNSTSSLSAPNSPVFFESSSPPPFPPSIINQSNHIKSDQKLYQARPPSLTLKSRYDFTNSLKLAASSPLSSPRFSSRFETVAQHHSSDVQFKRDSNTTNVSVDQIPRSQIVNSSIVCSASIFNQHSQQAQSSSETTTMNHDESLKVTSSNGNEVLASLRNFQQEKKLQGGHNLEVSDYGDLVQNFCWGGVGNGSSGHGGHNSEIRRSVEDGTAKVVGERDNNNIEILLESVRARFGSDLKTPLSGVASSTKNGHHHHHHHHHHNNNNNHNHNMKEVTGLGIE